ncbi:MAG: sugar-binding protein, partial [Armatimonadota bacterium]|nr:sugar-binding protein [Armatimonadota bacterium]
LQLTVTSEPAQRQVTFTLDQSVHLGGLRVPWTSTGENPAYNLEGELQLGVSEPVPKVRVSPVGEAPEIDGRLNDAAWQRDPDIPALNLLAGGKPATENTAVWLTYDAEALYVAFRCDESQMDKLVATFQDRGDPLYRDDDVEVFILPPDANRALQLAVNPLGTISDNFGSDQPWTAAARQYQDHWDVEMAIPFSVIGIAGAPESGTSWGMQFGRQQKAKHETTAWTPGRAFNVPEGFGLVIFE